MCARQARASNGPTLCFLSHSLTTYSIDPKTGKLTKLKEMPAGKKPN